MLRSPWRVCRAVDLPRQSMKLKGEYIAAQALAGAMFWELSNDDGSLLGTLRSGLGNPGPMPVARAGGGL